MIPISPIIIFFARWFPWIVIAGAILFLLLEHKFHPKKFLKEVLVSTSAMFIAWSITAIVKNITQIPRPFVGSISPEKFFVDAYRSFPSGHATVFFALATVIYFYNKKVGVLFFIAATIIACMRVLVGVHYPVDVVVGALIGVCISILALRLRGGYN